MYDGTDKFLISVIDMCRKICSRFKKFTYFAFLRMFYLLYDQRSIENGVT